MMMVLVMMMMHCQSGSVPLLFLKTQFMCRKGLQLIALLQLHFERILGHISLLAITFQGKYLWSGNFYKLNQAMAGF